MRVFCSIAALPYLRSSGTPPSEKVEVWATVLAFQCDCQFLSEKSRKVQRISGFATFLLLRKST